MTADSAALRQAAAKYRSAAANMEQVRHFPKRAPGRREAAEQERVARRALHVAIVAAVQGGTSQAEASRLSGLGTPHVCRLVRGVSSGRIKPPPSTRMPFVQQVSLDELAARYKAGETVAQLAEYHECSTTTIRGLLDLRGVKRRGRRIQLPVSSGELARRYLEGREKVQDLAAEFGVSPRTMSVRIAEAGVRVPLGSRRLDLPDAEIAERYARGETITQLSAFYGVSGPAIRRRIRENASRTSA
ncbi:hypothetical protein AB0D56_30580 [Streptomyces sp. NPDC048209]|uniref:hypothetical protein n=1 Tax=Streptomyces sp. NPDC048209 TaxID=3156689 RepID=UPI00343CC708